MTFASEYVDAVVMSCDFVCIKRNEKVSYNSEYAFSTKDSI